MLKNTRLFFLLIVGLIATTALQAQSVVNHNIDTDGNLIIPHTSTSNYVVTGITTTNQIVVGSGYQGKITLSNVSITVSYPGQGNSFSVRGGNGSTPTFTGSPMTIFGRNNQSNLSPVTKVDLVLEGDNLLYGNALSVFPHDMAHCGLQVDQGAQVHISAIDPNNNASGVLFARSGNRDSASPSGTQTTQTGAGIGALSRGTLAANRPYNWEQGTATITDGNGVNKGTAPTSGGNVIISSGTITAWGGHGAGIGGGYMTYYDGIIIIYGGIVNAYAAVHSAGIGSGCPIGGGLGVIDQYSPNSSIFVLPPAAIRAYGRGNEYTPLNPDLALAGTKNVTYLNDPNKHLMNIRTVDYEPNANIYLDLTETTGLSAIFNSLDIDYDLTKVRVGRTNTSGTMQLRGQLEQLTTFFTDASSSNAANLGRPYLPVKTTVLADQNIILPLLSTRIAFTDIPSIPMETGYTAAQALTNAPRIRVEYNDPVSMTGVSFVLQNGAASDFTLPIRFYGPDGVSEIAQPTTLTNGMVFYIALPIKTDRPTGIYFEVLLIDGTWGMTPLPGYIRRIGEQRIVYNDTDNNNNIKVTANPTNFSEIHPTSRTVNLTLNINHTGQSIPYDMDNVTAKYIVTTEPNYNNALAATPLSGWSNLNISPTEGANINTMLSFSGKPAGTYYIHWHVVSGTIYAHSKDVESPPRQYGAFGAYEIMLPAEAVPDTTSDLQNTQILIDVLANDKISVCPTVIPTPATLSGTQGSAVTSGNKILYTPAADFVGRDSLEYSIVCSGITYTAKIYVYVYGYPDNISDADCFGTPAGFSFNFNPNPVKLGEGYIHGYSTAYGGDIDGDGIPELFALGGATGTIWCGTDVYSFMGTGETKKIPVSTLATGGSIALGRVKTNAGDTTLVFLLNHEDKYMYAYSYHNGNYVEYWKSSVIINNTVVHNYEQAHTMGLADFNNDGYTEIYVNNSIFDAATGNLLCRATGNEGFAESHTGTLTSITAVGDFNGDGKLELAAGNIVWEVDINRPAMTGSMTVYSQMTLPAELSGLHDGHTHVVDLDLDGYLDVVVSKMKNTDIYIYVWNPVKKEIIASASMPAPFAPGGNWWEGYGKGLPFIGNIDTDPYPEIILLAEKIMAFKYDGTTTLSVFWEMDHTDSSFGTGMTLFDFNQDGMSEIVYRDETHLRIIDGSGVPTVLAATPLISSTLTEYPIILDMDNDGSAEIVISGGAEGNSSLGYLAVYKPLTGTWAPARKVWNQYAYNAVNVNNDLTIPQYQINPATAFPGEDKALGTGDDVHPYNTFLQQQTILSKDGLPLWEMPDVYPDPSLSGLVVIGDSVSVTVGITNQGDAAIGSPIFVTLYKDAISSANELAMDSANIQINPGETGYVTVNIPDIKPYLPFLNIVIRVNDRKEVFMYQAECKDDNNVMILQNPRLGLMMKKDATLLGNQHNGTYPNPVSVLFGEDIEYTITAVNASLTPGTVTVVDTIPAYLKYVASSADNGGVHSTTTGITPQRDVVTWTLGSVPSLGTRIVKFKATPVDGSSASQPLFINSAWVKMGALSVPTNSTYHQGAGVSITTFSAGLGGQIYNAVEQAIDYMTAPRSGIVIAPEEGYRFAGWSHNGYTSLRGKTIEAKSGIMYYDTLTVYGNVELHASFSLEEYAIEYYLNGSENDEMNPEKYTIKSGTIALGAPWKAGDMFIGWTGSNGETPQQSVVIESGHTGALVFYANFLHSGCEGVEPEATDDEDKVWAVEGNLYIRTSEAGSIVRIYSTDGILYEQFTIASPGVTSKRFLRGVYIVTINNNVGRKVSVF